MSKIKPVILIILDGWGIAPNNKGNPIIKANTPYLDLLFKKKSHSQLICYGEQIGLPKGQMGNSEVGHLTIGSGRIVYQNITRINNAIRKNELAFNPVITNTLMRVKNNNSTLHLIGLLSNGGVHSLQEHLHAIIKIASKTTIKHIIIHVFLDGRDTPPKSGINYLKKLNNFIKHYTKIQIATISGRFWAMDRDKRWDRIEQVRTALVCGKSNVTHHCPITAVQEAYIRQEYDEFITPIVITNSGKPIATINNGDAIIFFNFRADRARELTWAFTQKNFQKFDVSNRPQLVDYVCMTEYDKRLKHVSVVFPAFKLTNVLAEVISIAGLKQLHIAETEKYAHITFFFNGGRENPFLFEDRVLITSPKKVIFYNQKPAMSAFILTKEFSKHITNNIYDFIVINYANCDMVGHTGVMNAAIKTVEILDQCLFQVIPTIIKCEGTILLTSDHGNIEQMIDYKNNHPYTAHTVKNLVPILLIEKNYYQKKHLKDGTLCDVAPTILALMKLSQPNEMTGKNILF